MLATDRVHRRKAPIGGQDVGLLARVSAQPVRYQLVDAAVQAREYSLGHQPNLQHKQSVNTCQARAATVFPVPQLGSSGACMIM